MLQLRFNRLPAELLEIVLSDIASAVMDTPVALGTFRHTGFRGERRKRTLNADGVQVIEEGARKMEPGRDGGWGYSLKWTIKAKAPCGRVRLSFTGGGWEPIPNGLGLGAEGLDPPTFRRIRARLRARLGNDADQTDDLWPALHNIETALEAGHRDLAKELFDGAWTRPGAGEEVLFPQLEALRSQLYDGDGQPSLPPAAHQEIPPQVPMKPKQRRTPRKKRTPTPKKQPIVAKPAVDWGPDHRVIDAFLRDRVGPITEPCSVCAPLADGWLMVSNTPIVGNTKFGVRHPTLEQCLGVFRWINPPSDEVWFKTSHVQRCTVCGQLYHYNYDYDSDMFYGGTSVGIRKISAAEAVEFLVGAFRMDSKKFCWHSSGEQLLSPSTYRGIK